MKMNIESTRKIIPFVIPNKTKIEYGSEDPEDWFASKEKLNLGSDDNEVSKESNIAKTKVKKIEHINN